VTRTHRPAIRRRLTLSAALGVGLALLPPDGHAQGGAVAGAPIDFAALRDEAVRAMSEYLRLDTSNPPGNELLTARWLQAFLAREGIDGVILDTAELGPGRANFYARLKGDGSKRAIALVHHMDVVPANPSLWSVPPFSGEVKDGYVWGRGAQDMKGEGIIHLMAMVALKRAGVPLTRDIVFIANSDEEVEGRGATIFVARHRDLLKDVEFMVTEGEGTRTENGRTRWFAVGVAEKRAYWLRLVVHGTESHGSIPRGDNPVPRLARAITRVAAWQTPVRLLPSVARYFQALAPLSTGEQRAWLADPAAALKTSRGRAWLLSDPYRNACMRNTVVPTVLVGSTATNVIPSEASANLDVRLLPDEDTTAFRHALAAVIADTAVRIEALPGVMPAYNADPTSALVHAVEKVLAELLPGVPVTTPLATGATDRPTYFQAGIQAYGVEPFLIEESEILTEVHGNNERVSIPNVEFGLRLFVGMLSQLQ